MKRHYSKPSIRPRLWTFPRLITHGRHYYKPRITKRSADWEKRRTSWSGTHGDPRPYNDDPGGFDGGWRLQEYFEEQERERRKLYS